MGLNNNTITIRIFGVVLVRGKGGVVDFSNKVGTDRQLILPTSFSYLKRMSFF